MKELKVEITEHETATEPPVTVYNVVLQDEGGVWEETLATAALLKAFLRGLKAAYGMNGGHFTDPELPRSAWS